MERLNIVMTLLIKSSLIVLLFICQFVTAETLTVDTTWQAGSHIFTEDVVVPVGVTLTIDAGANIRFSSGKKLQIDNDGYLTIIGTVAEPVVFTSDVQSSGSWIGIIVNGVRTDTSDIQISHAQIEYATYGLQLSNGSKAAISHVTFNDNTYGIYQGTDSEADIVSSIFYNNTYGINASGLRITTSVIQSELYNNTYGIYLNGGWGAKANHPTLTITNNSIYDNSSYNFHSTLFNDVDKTTVDLQGNWWGTTDVSTIASKIYDLADYPYALQADYRYFLDAQNGDVVSGTHILGNISGEARWQSAESLVLSTTKVLDGAHLIIEAGSNIQFAKNTQLIINKNAKLTIVGDDTSPVLLTSDQQIPTAGDWKGIQIDAESGDVIISNTIIEYADKGVYISGKKAKATVTQSTIKNNNYGVFVNGGNVALVDHPVPVITNNEISNNVNYNYYTQSFSSGSSRTLNAKGNYWGSADSTTIAQSIYDNGDTSALPIVDYGLARSSEVITVTANAGSDLITFSTIDTDLISSGSGTITGYSWQQYLGEPITLINPTSATANFIAPGTESSQIEQLLSFTLTVTDANDISATDKLNVVVKPFSEFNQAPIVDESQEVLVTGGDAGLVTPAASDGDNDPFTYTWQQVSGEPITLAATNTDTLAFAAPSNAKNKVVSFKLTVTDGNYTVERTVVVAVKAPEATAGTYYYHNDHLGTPQVMTDTSATVVWQANYTPFGQADIVVETVTNNIRFPGQYYDQESELHYNYFRDYDPELGRYIQSDPIGLAGGINTYGYVGGNPVMSIDPYGLCEKNNVFADCMNDFRASMGENSRLFISSTSLFELGGSNKGWATLGAASSWLYGDGVSGRQNEVNSKGWGNGSRPGNGIEYPNKSFARSSSVQVGLKVIGKALGFATIAGTYADAWMRTYCLSKSIF